MNNICYDCKELLKVGSLAHNCIIKVNHWYISVWICDICFERRIKDKGKQNFDRVIK